MNRTTRTVAAVTGALAAAGIASFLVYRALERVARPATMAMTTVVIAARDVPAGTMLTSDDVKAVDWPAPSRLATSFTTVQEVVGRGTVDILRENEPLTGAKLAAMGAGAGLQPTIASGMRAISIHVNEIIGVAGFVTPGSRVDVLVTLDNPGSGASARKETTTRVVVSNVQVLTAGTRYDQDQSRKDGKPIPSSVVTLMVTPDDAERVALAQNEGKINLTLRNPLDVDPTSTKGAQIAGLLGKQTTPPDLVEKPKARPRVLRAVVVAPPAPEAKPIMVETIRAAKRTDEAIR